MFSINDSDGISADEFGRNNVRVQMAQLDKVSQLGEEEGKNRFSEIALNPLVCLHACLCLTTA